MSHSAIMECRHCGNTNSGELLRAGNETAADVEIVKCAAGECEVELCPSCTRYECFNCRLPFCSTHASGYGGGVCSLCIETLEPECTCVYIDVDLVDATCCELCNPASPYNQARTSLQPYPLPRITVRPLPFVFPLAAELDEALERLDEALDNVVELDVISRMRAALKRAGIEQREVA